MLGQHRGAPPLTPQLKIGEEEHWGCLMAGVQGLELESLWRQENGGKVADWGWCMKFSRKGGCRRQWCGGVGQD